MFLNRAGGERLVLAVEVQEVIGSATALFSTLSTHLAYYWASQSHPFVESDSADIASESERRGTGGRECNWVEFD